MTHHHSEARSNVRSAVRRWGLGLGDTDPTFGVGSGESLVFHAAHHEVAR